MRAQRAGRTRSTPAVAGRVQAARLAVSPPAHPPEAALLVEASLLAFGAKEAAVPKLAKNPRALHGGLEPLQKTFAVFTFPEGYV